MRLISFPGAEAPDPHEEWLTELEAALDGVAQGPQAEYWRDLSTDLRALTEPIDPAFEQRLQSRLSDSAGARRAPAVFWPAPGRKPLQAAASRNRKRCRRLGCRSAWKNRASMPG